jgi:hypothetical protein
MNTGVFADHLESLIAQVLEGTLVFSAPGVTAPAAPSNWYLGLFQTIPGDNGTDASPANGVEIAAAGGANRIAIPASGVTAVAPNSGRTDQDVTLPGAGVTFNNTSGVTWNGVGVGLWDGNSGTGADRLWQYWAVTFTTPSGQSFVVPADAILTEID